MEIRPMKEKDIAQIRELVSFCKPLDLHTAFTYWILSEYFSNTCLVLEDKASIVGYTAGLKSSAKKGIFYLWQIGLMPEYRGKGFFDLLLDKVIGEIKKMGCHFLEFSVLSDNYQSINAFSRYAKNKGLPIKKRGSLNFYDKLDGEEFKEDIYQILL